MIYLLYADLIVTGFLFLVLLAYGKTFCHRGWLADTGFRVAAATLFALLGSIILRIMDGPTGEPRTGYIFAVLSRFGMVVLFSGLALTKEKAQQEYCQEAETREESRHDDTPPVGTHLPVFANTSPLEVNS